MPEIIIKQMNWNTKLMLNLQ